MSSKYSFINRINLLIAPEQRVYFVLQFILATGAISIITESIHDRFAPAIIRDILPIYPVAITVENGMIYVLLHCISGLLLGTCQWLLLRQYIPRLNFMWINIWALFMTLLGIYSTAMSWLTYSEIDRYFPLLLIMLVSVFGAICIVSGLGYFQWLALRSHVAKARWWIATPFIAIIYVALVTLVLQYISRISDNSLLFGDNTASTIKSYRLIIFNIDIIQSTGLAFIQSIAFCLLPRKPHDLTWLNSPLALARDIASYRENQQLGETLYKRISRVWKTELADGTRLNYFVGVDKTGSIIACEPMTQSSAENIQLTPLLSLFIPATVVDPGVENLPPLAKFNVIFTAPGSLRVLPYRGIPLAWLTVVTFFTILGVSKLVGFFFGIDFFFGMEVSL